MREWSKMKLLAINLLVVMVLTQFIVVHVDIGMLDEIVWCVDFYVNY